MYYTQRSNKVHRRRNRGWGWLSTPPTFFCKVRHNHYNIPCQDSDKSSPPPPPICFRRQLSSPIILKSLYTFNKNIIRILYQGIIFDEIFEFFSVRTLTELSQLCQRFLVRRFIKRTAYILTY